VPKGISIAVGSDTKAFLAGIKSGVIAPLEDAADTLDDLARAGDKAGDKISDSVDDAERSLKDLGTTGKKSGDDLERAMKDAQGETKDSSREFKNLGDTIKTESRDAARNLKTNFAEGTDDAKRSMRSLSDEGGENIKEFGNEAKANLAETLSSFDGTVEGTLSGIQGTLGGVTAGLKGVAPIAIAAAGAAGVGAIIQAVSQASEESEEFKAKVAELATELIDAGNNGAVSIEYLADKLKELATATEEGQTNLKDLNKAADGAGTSFKDLAQAYAGSTDDLDKLVAVGKERLKQLEDESVAIDTTTNAGIRNFSENEKKSQQQEKVNAYLNDAKKAADAAAESERLYAASGGPEMEAKASRIAAINTAYDDLAGGVDNFIDKESGLFDIGAYLDAMHGREQGIRDYQDTLAKSALTPDAKAFLNDQGIEAAASFLQGYKTATPAQQAELNRIWTEAGKNNSGTYGTTVKTALSTAFDGVQINGPTVNANVKVDRRELDKVINAQYKVVVDAVTTAFGRKQP
jgi:F0F1-type ATP synthase membrane subunit b/b'